MKTTHHALETPYAAHYLAEVFQRHGYTLYAVGGWVRDQLLGRSPGDLDVAGQASPDQVKTFFEEDDRVMIMPRSLPMGTLIMRVDHGALEVEYTCFRSESYRRDGSHCPEVVNYPVSMEEDALRRDFTVNALYYDFLSESIVDPVGGRDDLEHNLLRAVREPTEVFIEDALRILRLCRQAADLNAEVDEATLKGAKAMAHLMENLSNERIGAEVDKLLMTKGKLDKGLSLLFDIGAAAIIDNHLSRECIERCVKAPRDRVLRWAAFLSAMALEEAKALMKRLCLGREIIADIRFILSHPTLSQEDIRWFMVQSGFGRMGLLLDYHEQVLEEKVSDHRQMLEDMIARGAVDSADWLAIDGKAIMDTLGIEPSERVGEIKQALLRHVAYHPEDNQRERLIALLVNGNICKVRHRLFIS